MFDKIKFKSEIESQGYSIVRNALPTDFIKEAKLKLEKAIQQETEYHSKNDYSDFGMVLLCSLYDKIFTDLFDIPLVTEPIETVLGKGSIVYAYTSSSMPPEASNFSKSLTDKPTAEEFYSKGLRLIEKAGTIWFFNARLWHAGGQNSTTNWRHALTLNMARPWMKQRIDIPKAMAHKDLSLLSPKAKQKLGFNAQVPESYDEYYVPKEQRKFKQEVE
jgi:ectoine hydroxylase-related dioxygenase (phytanoyl-CoA dioxygenase family)